MTRRILVSYLLMTLLILVMLTVPLGLTFAARERDRLFTSIERDARVLGAESDDAFEDSDFSSLPSLVSRYERQTGGRVVMVDHTGRSVIDSDSLDGPARDFSSRPEIAAALAGKFTSGARPSTTLGESLAYVAIPVRHDGRVLGAVRVSYPSTTVDSRTRGVWWQLISLDAIVLAVVATAGWFVARGLGGPIHDLESAADSLASGDLAARLPVVKGPTDLVRVTATFNTMADRLQTLVESQRSFLADASHQLRTPLTALRLRIESVADAAGEPSADLLAAMAEVDRLADLVDALLSLARLDAHVGDVVSVDVGAVTAARVATWLPLADEHALGLTVADSTGGALAEVVDGGLDQILDNLIANAVDHAPPHSSVSVTVELAGEFVVVTVADEGPGLSGPQLGRAFDRFWRGPNAVDGGSGLGLPIVLRLTEASGGTVTARSRPGSGLEVEVRLRQALPSQ